MDVLERRRNVARWRSEAGWDFGTRLARAPVRSGGETPSAADGNEFARRMLGFEPDAKQQSILTGEHYRLLLNCTRQWGKSTVTAAKAVHRAWSRAGSLTLVVSPSERQSREFLRKAKEFVTRLGIKPRGDGDNEISALFPNGSRIVGVPGKESRIRGFSAVSLLIIDEAAWVSDEQYLAVQPMLATVDGDLWLLSTPWGQRGFFWNAWSRGGDRWTRVSVPAAACPRISARFLESQRKEMGDAMFRREYQCEFMDANDAVFSREALMRAIGNDVRSLWSSQR